MKVNELTLVVLWLILLLPSTVSYASIDQQSFAEAFPDAGTMTGVTGDTHIDINSSWREALFLTSNDNTLIKMSNDNLGSAIYERHPGYRGDSSLIHFSIKYNVGSSSFYVGIHNNEFSSVNDLNSQAIFYGTLDEDSDASSLKITDIKAIRADQCLDASNCEGKTVYLEDIFNNENQVISKEITLGDTNTKAEFNLSKALQISRLWTQYQDNTIYTHKSHARYHHDVSSGPTSQEYWHVFVLNEGVDNRFFWFAADADKNEEGSPYRACYADTSDGKNVRCNVSSFSGHKDDSRFMFTADYAGTVSSGKNQGLSNYYLKNVHTGQYMGQNTSCSPYCVQMNKTGHDITFTPGGSRENISEGRIIGKIRAMKRADWHGAK